MFTKIALVVAVSLSLSFSQVTAKQDSIEVANDKKAQKIAMLVVTTLFVAVISGTAKTISSGKLTKNIE
ncbi:MAG: hypothetical protein M0Q13_14130 [Methanothrix sp.]|jgi:hypothetical protein|nr:hypothetical protein [Methanothrix sp.]